MQYLVSSILLIGLIVLFLKYGVRRETILEYERGLLYDQGRFRRLLEPGQYWHIPLLVTIRKLDLRPRFASIGGQEVLSLDGITLKVSLAAHYEIIDPIARNAQGGEFSRGALS